MQGNIHLLSEAEVGLLRTHKTTILSLLTQPLGEEAAIPPAPAADHYPLSAAQQRIWVLHRLGSGAAYHMSLSNVVEGRLDEGRLKVAFRQLLERHEILRTRFVETENGEVRQFIAPVDEAGFDWSFADLRGDGDVWTSASKLFRSATAAGFDLELGPLWRVNLLQVDNERWLFQLTIHHIIGDGWSMEILVRDLMQYYVSGTEAGLLLPLALQYKDFAWWQQEQLRSGAYLPHRRYWMEQLSGELPILSLQEDRPRPAVRSYNGAAVPVTIPPELTVACKALVRQQECTLFMAMLALVQALLYRYTAQEELVIGTPASGREQAAFQHQVGLYLNTVVLRSRCEGATDFLTLLAAAKQTVLDAQVHQAYPFDLLLDELQPERDLSRSPLFDVMVSVQDDDLIQRHGQELPGPLRVTAYEAEKQYSSKFDWTFHFVDKGDEITGTLIYNSDTWLPDTAARMGRHLVQLLASVVDHPTAPVSRLPYLDPSERRRLLEGVNVSAAVEPPAVTLNDLFATQVKQTPDTLALVFGDERYTYQELDEQSDRLAGLLQLQGIGPDCLVAILLDRSADAIIAILSVLKAGGAYVPVDPEYPADRIEYILHDCQAGVLITSVCYLDGLADYTGHKIAIDQFDRNITSAPYLPASIRPDHLAYVIYTSGSTGRPKGVMVEHGALVDYSFGIREVTNITDCQHFGLVSTIAADLGNTILYTALFTGGTLHVFSAAELMDATAFFRQPLDCIKIVPSHWKSLQLPDNIYLPSKCLIFGGEVLTADVLDLIRSAGAACQVYNHYGPTEATIGKLINRLDPGQLSAPVPLGRPFCRSACYLLDAYGQPVPEGVLGEICLSGVGLARGYYNQPELTAEKFIPHPLLPGERLYRTGDQGRWVAGGLVTFHGRKDDQVKIRGYRVEPGEIAAVLRSCPGVEAAIVLPVPQAGGDQALAAYVAGAGVAPPVLRAWLAKSLPAYMIPAHFILLDKLPLTLNGKVDRSALPPVEAAGWSSNTTVPPRNELEAQLLQLWHELLGNRVMGVLDNFFQLGGHSLKMMQLIARIHRHYSVRIHIQQFYKEPTIENIALQISFVQDQHKQKANRKHLRQVEI